MFLKNKSFEQLDRYLRTILCTTVIFINPVFNSTTSRILTGIGLLLSFCVFETISKKIKELDIE